MGHSWWQEQGNLAIDNTEFSICALFFSHFHEHCIDTHHCWPSFLKETYPWPCFKHIIHLICTNNWVSTKGTCFSERLVDYWSFDWDRGCPGSVLKICKTLWPKAWPMDLSFYATCVFLVGVRINIVWLGMYCWSRRLAFITCGGGISKDAVGVKINFPFVLPGMYCWSRRVVYITCGGVIRKDAVGVKINMPLWFTRHVLLVQAACVCHLWWWYK